MVQLNEAHQQLASAKGQVTKNTSQLLPNELEAIIGEIAEEFHVGINYGLEGEDISKLSPSKKFTLRFEKIVQNVIKNMDANGISNAANYEAAKLASKKLGFLYYTAGVHPHDAKDFDDGRTLDFLRSHLTTNSQCVAVGECGLDFNRNFSPRDQQLRVFEAQALVLHKHSNFKRNEPSSLAAICELVAAFVDCPAHELANATTENAQRVFAANCVHPHDAKDFDGGRTLDFLRSHLTTYSQCVAVGECGLDFNRNFSPRDQQLRVFKAQVQLACELGKPLFVHEREAHQEMVAILSRHSKSLPPTVIHCFTGTEMEAKQYMDMGLYIGLTGFLWKDRAVDGVKHALRQRTIRMDRLLLETDAPRRTCTRIWMTKNCAKTLTFGNESAPKPLPCTNTPTSSATSPARWPPFASWSLLSWTVRRTNWPMRRRKMRRECSLRIICLRKQKKRTTCCTVESVMVISGRQRAVATDGTERKRRRGENGGEAKTEERRKRRRGENGGEGKTEERRKRRRGENGGEAKTEKEQ